MQAYRKSLIKPRCYQGIDVTGVVTETHFFARDGVDSVAPSSASSVRPRAPTGSTSTHSWMATTESAAVRSTVRPTYPPMLLWPMTRPKARDSSCSSPATTRRPAPQPRSRPWIRLGSSLTSTACPATWSRIRTIASTAKYC